METPSDRTVYEDELAQIWFDDHGILCSNTTSQVRTVEKQQKTYSLVKEILGERRVPLLVDATNMGTMPKETRTYTSTRMGDHFTAMAVYAQSSMGKLVMNTLLALGKYDIPVQMFEDEHEAREWLKQYL